MLDVSTMAISDHDLKGKKLKLYGKFGPQGTTWLPITAINDELTPMVEITSHNKSHAHCYFIKSKDVKNKEMKVLCRSSHPKHFLKINVPQK